MAYPLTYVDDHGVLKRFMWHDYPMVVALVDPPHWREWSPDSQPVVEAMPYRAVKIWCGPSAHLPETREDWLTGKVHAYMARRGLL